MLTILSVVDYAAELAFARINLLLMMATFLSGGVFAFLFLVADTKPSRTIRDFIRFLLPRAGWFSRSARVDVVLCVVVKLSFQWLNLLAAIITTFVTERAGSALASWSGFQPGLSAGPVTIVLICVILFVFADLGQYLSHYLMHKNRYLWEFHKIHHSATFLNPFTVARSHPMDMLLDLLSISVCRSVPMTALFLLYGFSVTEMLAMLAVTSTVLSFLALHTLQHTHFPISFGIFDRVLISPRMHQVHHSAARKHWDKNIGARLSIWDWFFGTAYLASKDEVLKYGIGTAEDSRGDYQRIWWCLVGPVVNCWTLFRDAIRRLKIRDRQPEHIVGE